MYVYVPGKQGTVYFNLKVKTVMVNRDISYKSTGGGKIYVWKCFCFLTGNT